MRLIDANALIEAIRHDVDQTPDSNWGYGLNHAIPIVRSQPTVHAVPVVRCEDCRYWLYGDYCDKHGKGQEKADWFCADGERK